MRTGILSILTAASDVIAVHGIGSFFRSQTANDVDLVLVLRNGTADPGAAHVELHDMFRKLGNQMGVTFDLTVLLESELAQRLLVEQNSLVELMRYPKDGDKGR